MNHLHNTRNTEASRPRSSASLLAVLIALVVGAVFLGQVSEPTDAQPFRRRGYDPNAKPDRNGVPDWEVDQRFYDRLSSRSRRASIPDVHHPLSGLRTL